MLHTYISLTYQLKIREKFCFTNLKFSHLNFGAAYSLNTVSEAYFTAHIYVHLKALFSGTDIYAGDCSE